MPSLELTSRRFITELGICLGDHGMANCPRIRFKWLTAMVEYKGSRSIQSYFVRNLNRVIHYKRNSVRGPYMCVLRFQTECVAPRSVSHKLVARHCNKAAAILETR